MSPNSIFELLAPTASYFFKRPFYESKGFYAYSDDGKLKILFNMLGISQDDITVEIVPDSDDRLYLIKVSGKSEFENRTFSSNFSIPITKTIHEIVKSFYNGLMLLEIVFEEPVKPNVIIRNK